MATRPPETNPDKPDANAPSRRGLVGRLVPRSPTEAIQPVAAPPPPPVAERKARPVVNFVSGLLSFVMVLALVAGGALFVGKIQFYADGPLPSERVVVVQGRHWPTSRTSSSARG